MGRVVAAVCLVVVLGLSCAKDPLIPIGPADADRDAGRGARDTGGLDGDTGGAAPDTGTSEPVGRCDFELAPRAHLFDVEHDDRIVVDTSSLTFERRLTLDLDLRQGDVVVGSSSRRPFLRRLVSTSSTGAGGVRFLTGPATLRDAFRQLYIDSTCPGNGRSIQGELFVTHTVSRQITVEVADHFEAEGELSANVTGRVWILIEISPFSTDRFEAILELTLDAGVALEGEMFLESEIFDDLELASIPRARIAPPMVIGPVVVIPSIEGALELDVEARAGMRFAFDQRLFDLSGDLGIAYDGSWHPVTTATGRVLPNFGRANSFRLEPYGEVLARLSLPISFDLQLYGVAGPGVTVAPYAEFETTTTLPPFDASRACFDLGVEMRAGLATSVEAEFDILGFEAEVDYDLYNISRQVGTRVFPFSGPCCGDAECDLEAQETCVSCRGDCGGCPPQCTRDQDCGASRFCRNNVCLADVCTDGLQYCAGAELRQCSPNGSSSQQVRVCPHGCTPGGCASQCRVDTDCPAAQFCSGGGCVADVCAAGQFYCSGSQRRRCAANGGSFMVLERCPFACTPGACSAQCSNDSECGPRQHCAGSSCVADACAEGQVYCDGDELRSCDARGASSSLVDPCDYACINGACAAECTRDTDCTTDRYCRSGSCAPDACPQGQRFCIGDTVHACTANGASSMPVGAACPFGCSQGACLPQCVSDSGCSAGQHCASSRCVADVCPEGQFFCAGNERRRCSANGSSSQSVQTCPFTCSSGACTTQCTSDTECAAAQFCSNGSCVIDSCPEGQTYCAGNERRSCSSNGSFYSALGTCAHQCVAGSCVAQCTNDVDCSTYQFCHSGACVPDACPQGQRYCVGNERRECAANGSGETLRELCPGGCAAGACQQIQCTSGSGCAPQQFCQSGSCVADVCAQGQSFCVGNERRQCAMDGSGSTAIGVPCQFGCVAGTCAAQCANDSACPSDAYCGAGTCTPDDCAQDQPFCLGDERRLCNANGHGSTRLEDCPGGCSPGGCMASCGDGVCSGAEDPGNCQQDCRAWITNPNAPYFQGNPASTVGQCSTAVGWHRGNTWEVPRWTWASACTLPSANNLLAYAGYSVRWPVEIRRAGRYRITVWHPCVGEVCTINGVDPVNRYASGLFFGLTTGSSSGILSGPWALTPCQSNAIFTDVFLPAGNHQLILYDRGQSGSSCNSGTSTANRWVFADNAGIVWLGP